MPADSARFEWIGRPRAAGTPTVFLGLGPEPENLPEWFDLSPSDDVRFVECPAFATQVDGWADRVPPHFTRLDPSAVAGSLAASASVARYLPAQRAFPSFFAPLTARLALGNRPKPLKRTVWLPSGEADLLGRELALAFRAEGWTVRFMDHDSLGRHPGEALPRLLRDGAPDLFLSVNLKGLDPFGLGFALLREAGSKVAAWLVDNPFNLLPAVKSAYWRELPLFVTDHTFLQPLRDNGAAEAIHLPLAACPELFAGGTLPGHARDLDGRLVFVGRSAFPDREKFFAGLALDDTAAADADARRDYFWWRDRLGIAPLWPGNEVRRIAAGAESSGLAWKRACLAAAGPLTIFGDEGWRSLENADLRPVVDYYAHLPAIYRRASAVLNVTGMQLPGGLTQRHFDVWCAGGFLLTDAHAGLDIFPKDLTAPIAFTRPDEIPPLFDRFREESPEKRDLRRRWSELILREHTYANRVAALRTALCLP